MQTSLCIYSAVISVCSYITILLCFADIKGNRFISNDQHFFLPHMNNSCSWFLLGKRDTFYFCNVPSHSLETSVAFRILQIIFSTSNRSRKVAQQDLFRKRHYERVQSRVASQVQVLRFQGPCFGGKLWLSLMPVHSRYNGHFLEGLFKEPLWCCFWSASQRLTADVCLMCSHFHCYL